LAVVITAHIQTHILRWQIDEVLLHRRGGLLSSFVSYVVSARAQKMLSSWGLSTQGKVTSFSKQLDILQR